MKSNILWLFIALCSPALFGQVTVSGTVYDATSNQPLPGATILIESGGGTSTDFDGKYTISDLSPESLLIFSYVGFKEKRVTVGNQTTIDVYLEEDAALLEEVIVIGYGTSTKKELTGAVSVVSSESIEELNPQRVEQALQGQVAGVQVTSSSGAPGSGLNIRIRGIGTNGDARPLILVDGNVIEDLSVINPNDIESINVLKDATAGIYGVRSANGVILITTKSGRRNTGLTFTYDAYGGFQETARKLPVLNATEYAVLINESFAAGGQLPPFPQINRLGEGTDWQDEIFDSAPIMNHSITVSGGTEKSNFSASTSLLSQSGIIGGPKSGFSRWTARINYNRDLLKNLNLTTNVLYTGTESKGTGLLRGGGLGSVLFNAVNNAPTFDVRNPDGTFTLSEGTGNEVVNPVAQIANQFSDTDVERISGKFGLRYDFDELVDGLSAEASVQYNYSEVFFRSFSPLQFYGAGKVFNVDRNQVNSGKSLFFDYTFDAFLTYNKRLNDDHKFDLTLGTSVFRTRGDSSSAFGFDIASNEFTDAFIGNATDVESRPIPGISNEFDARLLSFFARAQYNYKNKILLSGLIRRDGSTAFGPENRFGYFPSGSIGYVLSEEEFLRDNSLVSFLKLRASYGVVGNDRIGTNRFRSILNGEATYVYNDQLVFGRAEGALSNPQVQWEEQKTLDIGLDMNLFNDKVSITADYFNRRTEELLVSPPVSGILGVAAPGSGPPFVNAGTIENRGLEFAIGFDQRLGEDSSFSLNYNVTFLENEVISVNNGVGFIPGGAFGIGQDPPSRMEDGLPIGYFYGLETDGVFQNQAEVNAHATQNPGAQPGDLRFVDQNGDGVIDSDDRTNIGNPIPDATMGLNLSLNVGNWDFTAYAFAQLGNEIVRNYERQQNFTNLSVYRLDRWRGEGTSNTEPRVTTGATGNTLFSDYFVEDGSFVRIQNAQIGYSFPSELIVDKIGAKSLRVYVLANNLYTFTKYRGFDPAIDSGASIGGGIDSGVYPVARTYFLGLNLKF